MTRWILVVTGALMLVAGAGLQRPDAPTKAEAQVARGEYLVLHVAMCVQCHTPRDSRGELDRRRLLQGAPMPVRSPWPAEEWAFQAPSLRGLPGGWSEEQLVDFLQTGKDTRGRVPKPPMPPFRMTREDASAVAAYLKSLASTSTRPR